MSNPLREFWIKPEINAVHLKQLSEELIAKNPSGAMYVSAQIIHELISKSNSERELEELRRSEAMLAFMIENEFFVCEVMGRFYVTDESLEELFSITYQTPREAIAAAMAE